MHPAYSVILFTTASGAGYGLLIGLAIAVALNLVPRDPTLGFVGLGIALVLITGGLLSSTFHLGRPERAWRSFSQWRSSWLSREGVASLATYMLAGLLGLGWVFGEIVAGQIALGAWLAVPCALVTLWCTGMIYASLPTIRAWYQPLVAPLYVVLGLATGGVVLVGLLAGFGLDARWAAVASAVLLAAGWLIKARYWSAIDHAAETHTAEAATGLGRFGTVRPLDPPHTQPNYRDARDGLSGRAPPRREAAANCERAAVCDPARGLPARVAATTAGCDCGRWPRYRSPAPAAGVLVERWLFFAEARHVVTLYYRGGTA